MSFSHTSTMPVKSPLSLEGLKTCSTCLSCEKYRCSRLDQTVDVATRTCRGRLWQSTAGYLKTSSGYVPDPFGDDEPPTTPAASRSVRNGTAATWVLKKNWGLVKKVGGGHVEYWHEIDSGEFPQHAELDTEKMAA